MGELLTEKTLTLDGQHVVGVLGWYPYALVGDGDKAHELSVLKVRLEDGSEKLVSFAPPK